MNEMKYELFYDRSLRLWTLLWKDSSDNQVGCAEYFGTKPEALDWIAQA
jgi:hypothetical protein